MRLGLLSRRPHERAAFQLYSAALRQGREPHYFQVLGVPDTLDGRFDMVSVFAFLLVDRLGRDQVGRAQEGPGPALAQAVFDAMFADMDQTLREMGVGDLSVPKRMRAMWTAFNGRCHAYAAALAEGAPEAALAAALARNVWRIEEPPPPGATVLGAELRAQHRHLAGQGLQALTGGRVTFLPAGAA